MAKNDPQRTKARALVDPGVLTLGKDSGRTRKSPGPVVQANMAAAQPMAFKKGGKVRSDAAEDRKMISKMIGQAEKNEPAMARGGAMPRNKVARYAAGGTAKVRHQQATPQGAPMAPKGKRGGNVF